MTINCQTFDTIVKQRLFALSKDYLYREQKFQEFMSDARMAMASLDANVIGLAIAVYIYFYEGNNEPQNSGQTIR